MPKKKVLYYQKDNITILNDDILKTSAIESGSVDLVVTSSIMWTFNTIPTRTMCPMTSIWNSLKNGWGNVSISA
jgi:hypothetical protein